MSLIERFRQDFAISIAAIHHLSTPERRRLSVQRLMRTLHLRRTAPHSRFLIYVWAFEQGENSKRKMGTLGGDSTANAQDVLVPWVLQPLQQQQSKPRQKRRPKGQRGEPAAEEPSAAPPAVEPAPTPPAPQVYHRYYHLFVSGELEQLVADAASIEGFGVVTTAPSSESSPGPWLRIVKSGYERDNWWLEGEVGLA